MTTTAENSKSNQGGFSTSLTLDSIEEQRLNFALSQAFHHYPHDEKSRLMLTNFLCTSIKYWIEDKQSPFLLKKLVKEFFDLWDIPKENAQAFWSHLVLGDEKAKDNDSDHDDGSSFLPLLDKLITYYARKSGYVENKVKICRLLIQDKFSDGGISAISLEDDELIQMFEQEPDVLDATVPLETPVQPSAYGKQVMSYIDPLVNQEIDLFSASIDTLANRRTLLVSNVDKDKLLRTEARHKRRQDKLKGIQSSHTSAGVLSSKARAAEAERKRKQLEQAQLEAILQGSPEATKGGSRDLRLDGFDVSVVGKRILTRASMALSYGRRYGLVGRNGVGKSTLLRHISSRVLHGIPDTLSILHVEQEIQGDSTPVIESVLDADFKRKLLIAEEKRLSSTGDSGANNSRLQLIHQKLQELEADKARSKAGMILAGLGFTPVDQFRPTSDFSGGWRMRLALARALFCEPDLLLLDEPTNMLDFPSVLWLELYLKEWSGTLLIVSHDRLFLDSIVTDILHLHDEQLDNYRGDYGAFLTAREERLRAQQAEYEAQAQHRQHLQAFIDRWRYSAARASQAQSRIKELERMTVLKPVIRELPIIFHLPPVEVLTGGPLIKLESVSFGYQSKDVAKYDNNDSSISALLSHVTLMVNVRDRIALVGPNGAGKTTLLRLMVGECQPLSGHVIRHPRLRIGYFNQQFVEALDFHQTPVECLAQHYPGRPEEEYRRQLGAFGLSGPLALQVIDTLSGGQKSRLLLAMLSMLRPHLLIMDEPTNHLDMESIDALVYALGQFEGAVVAVSHDKRFVHRMLNDSKEGKKSTTDLEGMIWICEGGHVTHYKEGTIHDYARVLIQRRKI